jgi:hypothetical protein
LAENLLQPIQTGGSDVVPVEKQVLITLWYVGSLDTIRKIEDRFGVSESTVRMCRERVTAAILNNLKEKNSSWPTQQEMQDEVNAFTSASQLSTSLIVSKFWNRERFQGIQCKCGKRAYYFYIQLEFESNEIIYD